MKYLHRISIRELLILTASSGAAALLVLGALVLSGSLPFLPEALRVALSQSVNSQAAAVSTYTSSGTYVVPPNVYAVTIKAWGGGGTSWASGLIAGKCGSYWIGIDTGSGSGGGYAGGIVPVTPNDPLSVSVSAGGGAASSYGGSGGGYSGVFRSSASQANALLVAGGGGGGGAYSHVYGPNGYVCGGVQWLSYYQGSGAGGAGGGTAGGASSGGASGGTQSSGAGALAGGGAGGGYGGGGGGGWYGGVGGSTNQYLQGTAGGGGSGYCASSVQGCSLMSGSGTTAGNPSDPDRPSGAGNASAAGAVVITPAITMDFSATPTITTTYGGATLTWSTTGVTAGSCYVTNAGGTTLATTDSGSVSTGQLAATSPAVFMLHCTASGVAYTAQASVLIATTTIAATPAYVQSGQTTTINWTVANVVANSCSMTGPAIGLTGDASSANNSWTAQNITSANRSTDNPGGVSQYSLSLNGTNQYLSRTPSVVGNTKGWTLSLWVKFAMLDLSQNAFLFGAGSSAGARSIVYLQSTDDSGAYVPVAGGSGQSLVSGKNSFNTSSWVHVVVAASTTRATASDRLKLYLNGVESAPASEASYPALNFSSYIDSLALHVLGKEAGGGTYFAGSIADVNFVDGQQLTPSSFAQGGVPTTYTGSYGTNGFHLTFANIGSSGTNPTTGSGSFTTAPITADATYGISCSVTGGGSVSSSVTVSVDICTDIPMLQTSVPTGCQAPVAGICLVHEKLWDGAQCVLTTPSIASFSALSFTGSRVRKGQPAYLSWQVTGIGAETVCSISATPANYTNSFTGDGITTTWSSGPSGVATSPINAPTRFTLSCATDAGSISSSVLISLLPSLREI